MPFGQKPDAAGAIIDFDAVYRDIIAPAVEAAGLDSTRADEERLGGVIHKAMFERLILCPYAVADVTLANPNVLYELGVRHAVRPFSTVLIQSKGSRLPFDLGPLRVLPYAATEAISSGKVITDFLVAARNAQRDSPVFTFIDGLQPAAVAHEKTDVFRESVDYSRKLKAELAAARKQGPDAVAEIEKRLGPLADAETGVLVDLLLSYRATKAWQQMIQLVARMPQPLAETVMVREQLAFALNRAAHGEEAERVLVELIAERGASSESYGILGRVYKDRWDAAAKNPSRKEEAAGLLNQAIEAYLKGFEADWRDAYPGVNAVTLMEFREPPDERRMKLLPVVAYAVERKIAGTRADYWDYATLLELAVLAGDESGARTALQKALAVVRESWEPETTANNLRLIREARAQRSQQFAWALEAEKALLARAGR
jgi:hypothetical protein